MVAWCGCVIYEEDKLRLRPFAIKVKRVYTAGSVSYNRRINRKIVIRREDVQSRSWKPASQKDHERVQSYKQKLKPIVELRDK